MGWASPTIDCGFAGFASPTIDCEFAGFASPTIDCEFAGFASPTIDWEVAGFASPTIDRGALEGVTGAKEHVVRAACTPPVTNARHAASCTRPAGRSGRSFAASWAGVAVSGLNPAGSRTVTADTPFPQLVTSRAPVRASGFPVIVRAVPMRAAVVGPARAGAARKTGAAVTPAIARGHSGLRAMARINPAAIISDLLGPQELCLWRAPW